MGNKKSLRGTQCTGLFKRLFENSQRFKRHPMMSNSCCHPRAAEKEKKHKAIRNNGHWKCNPPAAAERFSHAESQSRLYYANYQANLILTWYGTHNSKNHATSRQSRSKLAVCLPAFAILEGGKMFIGFMSSIFFISLAVVRFLSSKCKFTIQTDDLRRLPCAYLNSDSHTKLVVATQ